MQMICPGVPIDRNIRPNIQYHMYISLALVEDDVKTIRKKQKQPGKRVVLNQEEAGSACIDDVRQL